MSSIESSLQLDKRRIARSFSRAAASYDAHAQLQRDIGEQLLTLLSTSTELERVLDLGSGTGFFTQKLLERCPKAHVIGLDLAEGMLNFSAQNSSTPSWLCADAESLPLANDSIDWVFSSLAVQWCENLPALFSELKRVLRPGAKACIATLGPDTLFELRQAWSAVDHYTHVNRFTSLPELTEVAQTMGLNVVASEQTRVLKYPTLRQLTSDLKGIGAHNVNKGELTGLSSRARIEALRRAYEPFRDSDGFLPASYQVFYLTITG